MGVLSVLHGRLGKSIVWHREGDKRARVCIGRWDGMGYYLIDLVGERLVYG